MRRRHGFLLGPCLTGAGCEPFMAGALKWSPRGAVHMPLGPSGRWRGVRTVRGRHADG